MTPLRWLGLICGLIIFLYMFSRFRNGRLRRIDFIWGILFSSGLIVVSAFPDSVNIVRDMLSLKETEFSRLLAIIIVSVIILWVLYFSIQIRWTEQAVQFDRLIRQMGIDRFRQDYPDIQNLPPITVVIPAFDEEDNIGEVLKCMPAQVGGKDIAVIVVDDGSRDNTSDAARESGAYTVKCPVNRGGGAALRMGFDIAERFGAEIIVTMDADGQHIPDEIERLVNPILSDSVDFVIGSRILGQREKDSFVRLAGLHVFNFLIRLLTPVKISDCSSGFRAFRGTELSKVMLRQDQYHTSEFIIDAAKKRIRIGEAPITIRRRLSGSSKKGGNWLYGFNFARAIFKAWWR